MAIESDFREPDSNVRFDAINSGVALTAPGRLLPADLLQTCHWADHCHSQKR
jgi:hypothetical protein